uniref:Uncharacterized protein n=1 Tax=Arundo donax TaxID=35708 RepID=A0A0A9GX43_ARUDO
MKKKMLISLPLTLVTRTPVSKFFC